MQREQDAEVRKRAARIPCLGIAVDCIHAGRGPRDATLASLPTAALHPGRLRPSMRYRDGDHAVADQGILMKHHSKGAFEVKLQPLDAYNRTEGSGLGRMSIDKQFHGELDATSQGEMLHAGNSKGSGGYVAIERVTGTLDGRRGAFSLQHNATMTNGVPYLDIIVVPGSGSGELVGLDGTMKIIIEAGGKHFYEFDYELAQ